jgi:hypothetical protein
MLKITMTCLYQYTIFVYESYVKIPTGYLSYILSLISSTYSG